jgi:hypothetical protein
MPEHPSHDPSPAGPPPPSATPAPTTPPDATDDRAGRYDANLKLIRRRLADESRTAKARKWWLGR